MFLEIYGNTKVRSKTWEYVCSKAKNLINAVIVNMQCMYEYIYDKTKLTIILSFLQVTNVDYLKKMYPSFNLSNLKYRERDQLESIFKVFFYHASRYLVYPGVFL